MYDFYLSKVIFYKREIKYSLEQDLIFFSLTKNTIIFNFTIEQLVPHPTCHVKSDNNINDFNDFISRQHLLRRSHFTHCVKTHAFTTACCNWALCVFPARK